MPACVLLSGGAEQGSGQAEQGSGAGVEVVVNATQVGPVRLAAGAEVAVPLVLLVSLYSRSPANLSSPSAPHRCCCFKLFYAAVVTVALLTTLALLCSFITLSVSVDTSLSVRYSLSVCLSVFTVFAVFTLRPYCLFLLSVFTVCLHCLSSLSVFTVCLHCLSSLSVFAVCLSLLPVSVYLYCFRPCLLSALLISSI